MGRKPATTIEATNIKAIRSVEGCKTDVRLAVAFEFKCELSKCDENLSIQISNYVMICGTSKYWRRFLRPLRLKRIGPSKADPLPSLGLITVPQMRWENSDMSKLDPIFPQNFIDEYRERLSRGSWLRFMLDEEEVTQIWQNIVDIFGNTEQKIDEQVLEPCKTFISYHQYLMVWIGRVSGQTRR